MPHDKLAVPEKNHQSVIIRAVSSYPAPHVRRMIRQAASDRQYPFQELRRNPLRFDMRSPTRNWAGADVDRQRSLQSVSSQECCRVFLPRPEANGKVVLDLLDLTYGLWLGRIAPHALNGSIHAFRNRQKFSRGNFLHAVSAERCRTQPSAGSTSS
jgi:hypothetical protein